MTKRSLYLSAMLVATMLFAGAVRAQEPATKPVQVYAAVGCAGKYVAWVVFSDGKVVAIDEYSGVSLKQLAEKLQGVPAQVRHFDSVCPITA